MKDDLKLKTEIIGICVELLEKHLVRGTGGNVSVRVGDKFLITPSGMDYRAMTVDDIVTMDFGGKILYGDRVPSIEWRMHMSVLDARPDISALIHTHSTYAAAAASSRTAIDPITDNQVAFFGGTIPCAVYAPIGSSELAENVKTALGSGFGVLLANHGALCAGRSLKEALTRADMLEEFAKVYAIAKTLGGGIALTAEETAFEREDLKKRYGQKGYNA